MANTSDTLMAVRSSRRSWLRVSDCIDRYSQHKSYLPKSQTNLTIYFPARSPEWTTATNLSETSLGSLPPVAPVTTNSNEQS